MNPLKITLLISLSGTFLLLLISNLVPPAQIEIINIDKNLIDRGIQVQGTVNSIRNIQDKSFQVLVINDSTGKVEVTLDSITPLKKGQIIQVQGKVTEYKKNLEIQADKITLVR
jgi:DNA/RNA endonuclease YhcR with UshA esterase domain